MEKTYKMFYEVTYNAIGMGQPSTKWFADRKAAEDFYKSCEAADPIASHRCSKPETIAHYNELVSRSNGCINDDYIDDYCWRLYY